MSASRGGIGMGRLRGAATIVAGEGWVRNKLDMPAALALIIALGVPSAAIADEIELGIAKGPAPGEVTLRWTGGAPPYSIYRDNTPNRVAQYDNLVAVTSVLQWVEAVPGDVLFYAVSSCGGAWQDCNGWPDDGCEADIETDIGNCGGCGWTCPDWGGGTPTCAAGTCSFECYPEFRDCDGDVLNGCETYVWSDVFNCGECFHDCQCLRTGLCCVSGVCTWDGVCCIDKSSH